MLWGDDITTLLVSVSVTGWGIELAEVTGSGKDVGGMEGEMDGVEGDGGTRKDVWMTTKSFVALVVGTRMS